MRSAKGLPRRKRRQMIAFRYTKTDGAEYLSHLDLLRHIYRTMRRAQMKIELSQGYHKHPRIFLNNPLGTGIKSVAEYATVDVVCAGDFAQVFNSFSPRGVRCLRWAEVAENQNYANAIIKCTYTARGIAPFDCAEFMQRESITITDLRGREVDIRPRIYAVERCGDELEFTLGCGENNLRPDLFCSYLCSQFGGSYADILKTAAVMCDDEFV